MPDAMAMVEIAIATGKRYQYDSVMFCSNSCFN